MNQFRRNTLSLAVVAAMAAAGNVSAAGVVATGGQTQVNMAGNTPVVNIAGANASGISRNTFSNFDVDKNGVVLNNLTTWGSSVLAGQLAANGNLNGTAAKVIVADVTSAQASKLNGAMEVAGAPAHVLIANAAGISANGASTINAPVLTLAAARFNPRDDSPLAVSVDQGRATPATIDVNGEGIDAGVGQLNLLSRATVVNAAVKAWNINSQNGTDFDGDAEGHFNGKLTFASETTGGRPAVALDVSELGGMYANKIILEGSEYGLGVNNAGLISGGQGGVAANMFGSVTQQVSAPDAPIGLITTPGIFSRTMGADPSYVLQNAANMQAEKAEFQQQKQRLQASREVGNAMHGWTPELEATLTDNTKRAMLADQMRKAQQEFAQLPAKYAAAAGAAAAADAQAKADAARAAAEEQARADQEARNRAEYEAYMQRQAAEQQARAEQEARSRAEQQARAEQEARDRAAEQTAIAQHEADEQQMRADLEARNRAEYEAYVQRQAAEQQARAEQDARTRAEQQARAEQEASERAAQQAATAQREAAEQQLQAEIAARNRAEYEAYMQRQAAEEQARAAQSGLVQGSAYQPAWGSQTPGYRF